MPCFNNSYARRFEEAFRYDPRGLPRRWRPEDDIPKLYIEARDKGEVLLDQLAILRLSEKDDALSLWPKKVRRLFCVRSAASICFVVYCFITPASRDSMYLYSPHRRQVVNQQQVLMAQPQPRLLQRQQ